MKGKENIIAIIVGVLLILVLPLLVNAQTDTSIWLNDMNYSSVSNLEADGWTIEHSAGLSFTSTGVVLDGSDADTAIHYRSVPAGTYNWAAEVKSRWLGTGHSGSSVCVSTEKHVYVFMPDGYYDNFAFYRDSAKVKTFEGYTESLNAWMTLRMEKSGDLIELYYNGQVIGTYTEVDTTPSQVVGVDMVSPWKGDAEYDYFQVWSISSDLPSIVPTPTISPNASPSNNDSTIAPADSSSNSVFSNPLVIGGIIGGVGAAVSTAVYYFVIAGGGEAAASAGAGSGAAASAGASGGGSGGGGGSLVHHPVAEPVEASVSGSVLDSPVADAASPLSSASQSSGNAPPNQGESNNTVDPLHQYTIQEPPQNHEFQTPQDVTSNKIKIQDKMYNKWDQYIFTQTDSDAAVADSGSGSGSSEG